MQKNISGGTLTLVGAIHNAGGRRWEHPTVEAEFYSASGKVLGEKSERMDGSVSPRSTENFSLSMSSIPTEFVPEQGRIEIKITDVHANAPLPAGRFEVPAALQGTAPKPASGNEPYQWVLRRQFIGTYLDSDHTSFDTRATDSL